MFRKIKAFFVNETIGDSLKYITKNKKLTNEEKLSAVFKEMQNFFAYKINTEANMATYEMHYESFMNGDQKDIELFNKFYKSEYENLLYVACLEMFKSTNNLLEGNFDWDKLTESNKNMLKATLTTSEVCGYSTETYPSFDKSKSQIENTSEVVDKLKHFAEYIKNVKIKEEENSLTK